MRAGTLYATQERCVPQADYCARCLKRPANNHRPRLVSAKSCSSTRPEREGGGRIRLLARELPRRARIRPLNTHTHSHPAALGAKGNYSQAQMLVVELGHT